MTMNVNVRDYGSLQNAMQGQTRSLTPKVGMGVTEIMYSDRHPFTVIEVLGSKRIRIQADIATRTDKKGCCDDQEYAYAPNPTGAIFTLRLNKTGRWKAAGDPQGPTYLIGKREEHYDFTR